MIAHSGWNNGRSLERLSDQPEMVTAHAVASRYRVQFFSFHPLRNSR